MQRPASPYEEVVSFASELLIARTKYIDRHDAKRIESERETNKKERKQKKWWQCIDVCASELGRDSANS